MSPYRIVHLSDLHLTDNDARPRSEPRLLRPLRGMNAAFRTLLRAPEVQNADLLLVTGDVTDRGDSTSWSVFAGALGDAGLSRRVLVIPGNHDVCCLGARLPLRSGYPRADLARAARGLRLALKSTPASFFRDSPGGRFPWLALPTPELAVIGMNSNNLGNLSVISNAMGAVDFFQLERLARLLWRVRDVPVKILALHHSPNIPGPATARRRGQQPFSALDRAGHQVPEGQRRALRLLCLSHRVRLIVHGHLHRAEDRRVNGVRVIGAPASTEPERATDGRSRCSFFSYTLDRGTLRLSVKLERVTV
jgi:3',5'-cyclic AMP phosphodiesterase CpdA